MYINKNDKKNDTTTLKHFAIFLIATFINVRQFNVNGKEVFVPITCNNIGNKQNVQLKCLTCERIAGLL